MDAADGIDQTVLCHAPGPHASHPGRRRGLRQFITNRFVTKQCCPKRGTYRLQWRDDSRARRGAVSQVWIS